MSRSIEIRREASDRDGRPTGETPPVPVPDSDSRVCLRCGFAVPARLMGCKNPCANCGFVYPLGDCSD